MPTPTKIDIALQLVEAATVAVQAKERLVKREVRRGISRETHLRQEAATERDLQAALEPLFREQAASIAHRLRSLHGKGFWTKGDSPGHPFRGNQWDEGSGGKDIEGYDGASSKVKSELDRVSGCFSNPNLSDDEKVKVEMWKTGNANLLKDPGFISMVEKGSVLEDVVVYRAGSLADDKALEFTTREGWARDTAEASDRLVSVIHLKVGDRALFVPYATSYHLVEVGVLVPPSTMRKYSQKSCVTDYEKGDLPGHEFRGNQWTDGGGSSGAESEAQRDWLENGVESKAFKAWFGDSKVVDKDGKPLVVYHGSAMDIKQFDGGMFITDDPGAASAYAELKALQLAVEDNDELGEIVEDILSEEGGESITDLGPDRVREIAEANGIDVSGKGAVMYPLYARAENPLDLERFGSDVGDVEELWKEMHGLGLLDDAWESLDEDARQEVLDDYGGKALYKFLENKGIQAKAFSGEYDAVLFTDMQPDGGAIHRSWLLKGETQVKSAIGNRGTFDPDDPNITKSFTPADAKATAGQLIRRVFDPDEWHARLMDRALPVLAIRMAEAARNQMLAMGVDPRRNGKVRKGAKGDVVGHEFHGNQWTDGGMMAPDTGGGTGGGVVEESWNNPSREQLDRSQAVFDSLEEGPASKFLDRQMRGGKLEDGKFTDFTRASKQTNLRNIKKAMDALRKKDPEAFEASRQWSLAEMFGVKNYSDIPDEVEVYRGHGEDEKLRREVNVTGDRGVAENFGSHGIVTTFSINKRDISFTLQGSVFAEKELLVFNSRKMRVMDVKPSDHVKEIRAARAIEVGSMVKMKNGESGVVRAHGMGSSLVVEFGDKTDYSVNILEISHE